MKLLIPFALLILPISPALAQQPRQFDLQIFRDQLGDAAVATAMCNSDAKAAAQTAGAQIAKLQARVKELEDKYEAKEKKD